MSKVIVAEWSVARLFGGRLEPPMTAAQAGQVDPRV